MGMKVDYNGFYEIKKKNPIFLNFGGNIAPQSVKNSDFSSFLRKNIKMTKASIDIVFLVRYS